MPTYEYRCEDCGEVWQRREPISQHDEVARQESPPPRCPQCEGENVEQVFSGFFAKTGRKS